MDAPQRKRIDGVIIKSFEHDSLTIDNDMLLAAQTEH